MDLYGEDDDFLSTDEYSEDNCLLNEMFANFAKSSKENSAAVHTVAVDTVEPIQLEDDAANKQSNRLPKRLMKNRLNSTYKNKSIKWLNNKNRRQISRKHLHKILLAANLRKQQKNKHSIQIFGDPVSGEVESIAFDKDNDNMNTNPTNTKMNNMFQHSEVMDKYSKNMNDSISIYDGGNDDDEDDVVDETPTYSKIAKLLNGKIDKKCDDMNDMKLMSSPTAVQDDGLEENAEKFSVISLSESDEDAANNKNHQQQQQQQTAATCATSSSSSNLTTVDPHKKIANMFNKLDAIASEFIAPSVLKIHKAISEKMDTLSTEINQLEEIIVMKMLEWNRLVHLKTVKEEIHKRLNQKKNTIILSEKYSKTVFTLDELAELERYFSMKNTANEDIPLNIFSNDCETVSNSPGYNNNNLSTKSMGNTSSMRNRYMGKNYTMSKRMNSRNNMNNGINGVMNGMNGINGIMNTNRSMPTNRSDFSIISDSENLNSKPTCSNHIADTNNTVNINGVKYTIINCDDNEIDDSTDWEIEALPTKSKQSISNAAKCRCDFNNLPNSPPEYENGGGRNQNMDKLHMSPKFLDILSASSSPASASGGAGGGNGGERFLDLSKARFVKSADNTTAAYKRKRDYIRNNFQRKSKTTLDGGGVRSTDMLYPLCQRCKLNESRFVCAGCGNQWYCSRTCQISAWDLHSENCTD